MADSGSNSSDYFYSSTHGTFAQGSSISRAYGTFAQGFGSFTSGPNSSTQGTGAYNFSFSQGTGEIAETISSGGSVFQGALQTFQGNEEHILRFFKEVLELELSQSDFVAPHEVLRQNITTAIINFNSASFAYSPPGMLIPDPPQSIAVPVQQITARHNFSISEIHAREARYLLREMSFLLCNYLRQFMRHVSNSFIDQARPNVDDLKMFTIRPLDWCQVGVEMDPMRMAERVFVGLTAGFYAICRTQGFAWTGSENPIIVDNTTGFVDNTTGFNVRDDKPTVSIESISESIRKDMLNRIKTRGRQFKMVYRNG